LQICKHYLLGIGEVLYKSIITVQVLNLVCIMVSGRLIPHQSYIRVSNVSGVDVTHRIREQPVLPLQRHACNPTAHGPYSDVVQTTRNKFVKNQKTIRVVHRFLLDRN
jgi:hypothetical protein